MTLAIAASSAFVAPAMAGPRISDVELFRVSRCLGLAKAQALGAVDVTALQDFVKVQRRSRERFIVDRSITLEQTAERQAGSAKDDRKAALIAERDGACKAMIENPAGA
jgi:hypothetical protein